MSKRKQKKRNSRQVSHGNKRKKNGMIYKLHLSSLKSRSSSFVSILSDKTESSQMTRSVLHLTQQADLERLGRSSRTTSSLPTET